MMSLGRAWQLSARFRRIVRVRAWEEMGREPSVRTWTAHGVLTEGPAAAGLRRLMEGVEGPSTLAEEVVVQLHSRPSHRTHM